MSANFSLTPLILAYIAINLICIYVVYKWLFRRINSKGMAWLFSISLCLGSTFLIALLILMAVLRM